MQTVHKYTIGPVDNGERFEVTVPGFVRFLSLGVQTPHHIALWCQVYADTPANQWNRISRARCLRFLVVGTGFAHEGLEDWEYVGTAFDGAYVWHVYCQGLQANQEGEEG